mmetsp:Transcript_110082/g.350661  ORF Transcript_110082/g.350661 Transcript_110082/m.350661 type:complete len:205 (-) Transcript_110082:802-1416(-)
MCHNALPCFCRCAHHGRVRGDRCLCSIVCPLGCWWWLGEPRDVVRRRRHRELRGPPTRPQRHALGADGCLGRHHAPLALLQLAAAAPPRARALRRVPRGLAAGHPLLPRALRAARGPGVLPRAEHWLRELHRGPRAQLRARAAGGTADRRRRRGPVVHEGEVALAGALPTAQARLAARRAAGTRHLVLRIGAGALGLDSRLAAA